LDRLFEFLHGQRVWRNPAWRVCRSTLGLDLELVSHEAVQWFEAEVVIEPGRPGGAVGVDSERGVGESLPAERLDRSADEGGPDPTPSPILRDPQPDDPAVESSAELAVIWPVGVQADPDHFGPGGRYERQIWAHAWEGKPMLPTLRRQRCRAPVVGERLVR